MAGRWGACEAEKDRWRKARSFLLRCLELLLYLLASWPGVWLRGSEGGGAWALSDSSDSSGMSGFASEIFWERTTFALRGDRVDLSEDLAESAMMSREGTASGHGLWRGKADGGPGCV